MTRTITALAVALLLGATSASAATYRIDERNSHAFVQFRIKHLGYSWLYGRFNDFAGTFVFDEQSPGQSQVEVVIETTSVDTNHERRDDHLRSDDFFAVEQFPQARFVSTSADLDSEGNGTVTGDLMLHGVTRPVTLQVEAIGAGDDPWGGYRRGFEARGEITLSDFGIDYDLGPASRTAELMLSVEGIRQQ